ncbi:MAG: UDP-forming cellulose synthase catalytic subunit [Campylobacterota bacterium]|nr:UDP-forming cellulose synthase catalytic subunit [Campylobacterota bacterium]
MFASRSVDLLYHNNVLRYFTFLLMALSFYILISSQYKISIQFTIGYGAVLFMFIIFQFKHLNPYITLFAKILGIVVVLRYLYWRTFSSLTYEGFFDFIGSLLLYSAEVFAIIIYLMGIFTSLSLLKRKPVDLSAYDIEEYPTVDVLIPTYNEPEKMIQDTVLASLDFYYPDHKFNVYVLDDGGTDQKCNDKDPAKAKEAKERRENLQEFCAEVGATYLTRERNEDAKAGNLNSALAHISGDLILILDTDHIPARQFLQRTVGWFLKDEKMFLVQTPHAFYNADPIERNLRTTGITLGENDMFYKYIQNGHDFWESAFFCGSAAVLKRQYIDELGGIAGETITEDAETAIKLHDRGYRSAYIDEPMVRGLQAESFDALVLQRVRWTQGMVQIFLLKNPFLSKKLKWFQKISYTSASFFWFFAYSRIIFFIAPLFYLFFGLKVYNANGIEVLAYVVPHMIMAISMSYFLYAKVRNPFFSELYETVLSFFTLPAIISTLWNPRNPTFKVTPKGHNMTEEHVSELGVVFVVVFVFVILGFVAAAFRLIYYPSSYEVILATVVWNVLNLVLIVAAIGVTSEKKESRKNIRIPLDREVTVYADGVALPGIIDDISEDGIGLRPLTDVMTEELLRGSSSLEIEIHDIEDKLFSIPSTFLRSFGWGSDYIFVFDNIAHSLKIRQKLIHLIYGNTTNWGVHEEKKPVMTPMESLRYIIKQSVKNARFRESFLMTFGFFKRKLN